MESDQDLASIDNLFIRTREGTQLGSLEFKRRDASGVITVKYILTGIEKGQLSNKVVESSYFLSPTELLEMMHLLEDKYSDRDATISDSYHNSKGERVYLAYKHLGKRVIIHLPNDERVEVERDTFLGCLYLIGPVDPALEKSLIKLVKQIGNPNDEERIREAARFITLSPDQITCLEALLNQVKENQLK